MPAGLRLVALAMLLGACTSEKKLDDTGLPGVFRSWEFFQMKRQDTSETRIGPERTQENGEVKEVLDLGAIDSFPSGKGPRAEADVYSSATGETYWVSAEKPQDDVLFPDVVTLGTTLRQIQYFRKVKADASLRLVVTKVVLEAADVDGAIPPTGFECPWASGDPELNCRRVMWPHASFRVEAFDYHTQNTFFRTGGFAGLTGWRTDWDYETWSDSDATVPLWSRSSFELEPDVSGDGSWGRLTLATPITITIPLASVRVNDVFNLSVSARAVAHSRRTTEREYVGAFLRDPQATDGLSMELDGVELVPPQTPGTPTGVLAVPCAGSTDPAAGTVELASPTFSEPEQRRDEATVLVRRTGGTRGAISVRLRSGDGTATAGTDYTALDTQVLFADGEEGVRAARLVVSDDTVVEPDETLTLTLSEPGGCAALGAQTTAVFRILDDDRDLSLPTYTVGGTVTGLVGTGLRLREARSGFELTPGNGSFTFGFQYLTGGSYEVRIEAQPQNPLQVCRVERGTGTVAAQNVTDVLVSCSTPDAGEGVDPAFGKVTSSIAPIDAVALDSAGRVVAVGGTTVARFRADGTLDPSFGTGGKTTLVWASSASDVLRGVAIRSDGGIVVVGTARGATEDFGVAQLLDDGTPNPGFGTGGKVVTDFAGSGDRAWDVALGPNGSVIVAGHAARSGPVGPDSDFALARYTAAGSLDPTFGDGGTVTVDIVGASDLGFAVAVDTAGRAVVAGRAATSGGALASVGLLRVDAAGTPDSTFGGGTGKVTYNPTAFEEIAQDVVLQDDGKIVIALHASNGTSVGFGAARFSTEGVPDVDFGSAGLAIAAFSTKNDFPAALAVDALGRIVVAGQASNQEQPDFAVARFLPTGGPDPTFFGDGTLTVDFFGAADDGEALLIQPDGKIIVAGSARSGSTSLGALVRLVP